MTVINLAEQDIKMAKTRIHVEDPDSVTKFCEDLAQRLHKYNISGDRPVVLLCIGTDRSTGDCLGPLIGTKLSSMSPGALHVYGTLDHPVHAGNMKEKLAEIYQTCNDPFIIAVDACLGNIDHVGCVNIGDGSLQPGAGVNKTLPSVGEVHITGIVNVGGFMEYLVLQNTRLNLVMKMANIIVDGLFKYFAESKKKETRGI